MMNTFGLSDSEYHSIVSSIFSNVLKKRFLVSQWKVLNDYLLKHIGDSEKENKIEQVVEEIRKINKEEETWSHLENCIYLHVFPYIPQVDYQNGRL